MGHAAASSGVSVDDDPAESGVRVGVVEDVERLVARDYELERVGGLVDHDDSQGVVGRAPEEEDIDPVRRAVRELTAGGWHVDCGHCGAPSEEESVIGEPSQRRSIGALRPTPHSRYG